MTHKSFFFFFLWNAGLFESRIVGQRFPKFPWPLAGSSIHLKSSNSSLRSFARLFRYLATSSFASEEPKSVIQSHFRFLSKRLWPGFHGFAKSFNLLGSGVALLQLFWIYRHIILNDYTDWNEQLFEKSLCVCEKQFSAAQQWWDKDIR